MDIAVLHTGKTYADRFGSLNKTLNTSGLKRGANEPNGTLGTPEADLLVNLKTVAEIVGETPPKRSYKQDGEHLIKNIL